MKAALGYLNQEFAKLQACYMPQVGGQLVGLVSGVNQIKGVVTIATSSGYSGNMPLAGGLKSFYFFEIIRPIVHLVFGYTKVKSLGIMEDMPKNVTNT